MAKQVEIEFGDPPPLTEIRFTTFGTRKRAEQDDMPTIFEGKLFADYHQVYLCDAIDPPSLPDEWPDDHLRRRVNLADRAHVISTARDMEVPVKVELHATRPTPDLAVDHAVEASLRAPSGKLIIAGLTDDIKSATQFAVPAGDLRALVLFAGLGMLSEDGLEGDDRYTVHLWPEKAGETVVHRQWHGE
jgi:hypothetical protein